ncbi:glucosamine-6-phosphate deaminase [Macrococcoides caseolyticum]|uniref:glucosamine-6-phosphate deaminase n=1 Tax=Macrococcoides caseolyticum TaxID=69966 RepID=UPI001F28B42D|nr:glucosamine-6-phosphate deaminase [Macrococcus caseolyticus]MCE4956467.1 glucosamine-6-phosphate deaminase [Macrococcus caseolyticus]
MEFINLGDTKLATQFVAIALFREIQRNKHAKLGLATGGTMEAVYEHLVHLIQRNPIDLSEIQTFNLDEYYEIDTQSEQSYLYYMKHHLFNHVDIKDSQYHFPGNAAEHFEADYQAYDDLIMKGAPITLQILGIGTNGHIGFNEPGTSFDSVTRKVDLTEETIRANARYFESIEAVPRQAVTMGISTIMKSNRIILLATGEKKKPIIQKLYQLNNPDETIPASVLLRHSDVLIVTDDAASPY